MKSTSSRSAKRRPAKRNDSSPRSRTNWTRLRQTKPEDILVTAEHPELDPRHVVRSIVRQGLKPIPAKAAISLRIDVDVLEWFKSQGSGYQTRMNAVLRAFRDASA